MKQISALLVFTLAWLCCKLTVYAAPLTVQFTGIVTDADASLGGEFSVGDSVTGRFSIETTDTSDNPQMGVYTASNLSLEVDGDYSLMAAFGTVRIQDNFGSSDSYLVSFSAGLVGRQVNGRLPVLFDIQLDFPTNTFSSDAFPVSVPLQQVDLDRSNIDFTDDSGRLSYRVTSTTVVPEPSAFMFCTIGLTTMLLKRRSWRRTGTTE